MKKDCSALYDAYYYAHDCGRPYQRDAEWLRFFEQLAEQLIHEIAPRTVLDAGCAMGFLVEALRRRNVEAYGVDISSYAIQNAHPDIQLYCWVGSVTEAFPQKYDLIVSIEVLEHMPKSEAEQAIVNLCRHTDDIVFSSTPFDYNEVTHINVHNPDYWAMLFAKQGFFRDQDFDASFLTPWAVRFRRRREPLHRIVQDYERRFWVLGKENTDLRELSLNLSNDLRLQQVEACAINNQIQAITKQNQTLLLQRELLQARLDHIETSMGWVLVQKLQRLRAAFFPIGTKREQWLEAFCEIVRVHRLKGGIVFVFRSFKNWLRSKPAPELAPDSPVGDAYQAWFRAYELNEAALIEQQAQAQTFTYRPLISFITPVYNPPPAVLRQMLAAVLAQTYTNWELCLVNASTAPEIQQTLDEFAAKDDHIRVKHLKENLGIAGNSNQALEMARGEFITLLDHDDLVAPNMLYEVAQQLNQQPQTDVIYFDEDKIHAEQPIHSEPFFKPDWSPYMLLAVNYLTHAVYRRALVLSVGKFDPSLEGAQDWDLALRCTEQTDRIAHIPKVLYHWRKLATSTAQAVETTKPWAHEAQVRAVQAHLQRRGESEAQAFLATQAVRVQWPHSGRKVSIIIPTRDKPHLLMACLASILERTAYPNYEIILVDNDSVDTNITHYYRLLRAEPRVKIVPNPGKFNYSAANNLGARHATGDLLLFLNNDTEVLDAEWLDELVSCAERPDVGAVGAKLVRPDGTIQHAGVIMGMIGHCAHIFDGGYEQQFTPFGLPEWYRDYQAVTGACMLTRREIYETLGPFDETYIIGYSDIDFCLRAREAHYTVIYTPFARLLHHEGASRGLLVTPGDVLRATVRMWPYIEAGDRYFNPNLSYAQRVPALVQVDEDDNEGRLIDLLQAARIAPQIERGKLAEFSAALMDFTRPWAAHVVPPDITALPHTVMLVTHDLSLSGAPIVLAMLAAYLKSRGLEVTVYSPVEGPCRERYQLAGIEVHIEPDLLVDGLRASEIVTRYDVVVANTMMTWQVIHAARAFQRPVLWWLHESLHGTDWASREHMVATAFREVSALVFATQATADLYQFILRGADYHIIPYGVDMTTSVSAAVREAIVKPQNKFCIVHAGSVEPRKGQDLLLDAISALPREVRDKLSVYFLGRELEPAFCTQFTARVAEASEIAWVGEASYEEFLRYLEIADVFVMNSRDEVLPMTLLTAMGYGKPIIATTVGGVAEVLDHEIHGLLIPNEDVPALRETLLRMFEKPELRQRLGYNAQRRFEKQLTVERFGEAMLAVIQQIFAQWST